MGEKIIQGVERVVDLYDQSGHSVSADTDITAVAHDGVAGSESPSATGKTASFLSPLSGMARIAFVLSAVAEVKVLESANGTNFTTASLNSGVKLQADILSWPIRRGWTYKIWLGDAVTLYSLLVDAVKE